VFDDSELRVLFNKAEREIFNSYLKYESSLTKKNPLIIQEYLEGDEFGLDVINDLNSNYVTTFAKQKLTMRAGETDVGKTVSAEIFNSISKLLSNKLKHQGILSVDCISTKGNINVIELNCRISGHYPISQLAGANIPRQIIEWLENGETNYNLLKVRENILITKELVPKVINN
jgi:carbamoyl-phosphate synthase large subunit